MDAQNTLDCELPGLGSTLGPFALKVAKRVEDPRFPREVALLQSLRHAIVPTLAAAETDKVTTPGPVRRQPLPLWAACAAVSIVGGLVVLTGGLSTRSAFFEFMQRDEALVRDTRNGGVGEKALNEVLVMPRVAVPGYAIGRPMPKELFPGQRRPPCNPDGQRAINGGCWFGPSATLKPPCGKEAFAHEDGCYMPLFDAPAPPASGQPR